jgi:GT2 family glycosyltransferase
LERIVQKAGLGITIVSYNTIDLLRNCLSSLQTCPLPLRVIVVDNASPDRSAAMVQAEFPEAQLVANRENLGFATATNQGLRALGFPTGDAPAYALLLNPDTEVLEGALERLVNFMETHPRTGAAGPRLLNPDGTIQENAFTFPTLWMSFFDFFPLHGRIYRSRLNGRFPEMYGEIPFPIDHPLGACLILRRETLQEVGLLDEAFFIYVEEVDLCYRIKQAGWQVYHVPSAQVIHHGGQSTGQMAERMFVELHRSRFYFFRKHYSPAFCWAHRQITWLGLAWRGHQDRRAHRRSRLGKAALDARLAAYRQVASMRVLSEPEK